MSERKVKKTFAPFIALLESFVDKNGKSTLPKGLMEKAVELASSRAAGTKKSSAFIKSLKEVKLEDGTVVPAGSPIAIRCYYFKRWMPLYGEKAVEFGKKVGTTTGFNTMCKVGNNAWNTQNRKFNTATAAMYERIENFQLEPKDIPAEKKKIADEKNKIIPTDLGFADLPAVSKYLKALSFEFDATAPSSEDE